MSTGQELHDLSEYLVLKRERQALHDDLERLVSINQMLKVQVEELQTELGAHELISRNNDTIDRVMLLLNTLPLPLVSISPTGTVESINVGARDLIGDVVVGKSTLQRLFEEGERPKLNEWLVRAFNKDGAALLTGLQLKHRRVKVSLFPSCPYQGERGEMLVAIGTDEVSNQSASQILSASVLDQIQDGVLICNHHWEIIYANPAFTDITGHALDDITDKTPEFLHASKEPQQTFKTICELVDSHGRWNGQVWSKRYSGELYPQWQSIYAVDDVTLAGRFNVIILDDITAKVAAETKLTRLAFFDNLTGLANRGMFYKLAKKSLSTSKRSNSLTAILFLDLDNFKEVNDRYGHKEGDEVLTQVSDRIRSNLREGDVVARFGGDEFAIVLDNLNYKAIGIIADKITENMCKPFVVGAHGHDLSCSIGVSVFPNDAHDLDTLIQYADVAMYASKEAGKNQWTRFRRNLLNGGPPKERIEHQIVEALNRKDVFILYQPVVRTNKPDFVEVEALCRLKLRTGETVSPDVFIPIAEQINLINDITHQVVELVVEHFKKHLSLNIDRVNINFSAKDLVDSEQIKHLIDLLESNRLSVSHFGIEVSEEALASASKTALAYLYKFEQKGGTVVVDDFGRSHTSLKQVLELPVNQVKLDRSLCKDIQHNSQTKLFVKLVSDISASLGFDVVMKGVESEEQQRFLQQHNILIHQGCVISEPLNRTELQTWLGGRKNG